VAALGSIVSAVTSILRRTRGCWSRSARKTAEKAPAGDPGQPSISLWSASGSSA
jgi:hypothetical protein